MEKAVQKWTFSLKFSTKLNFSRFNELILLFGLWVLQKCKLTNDLVAKTGERDWLFKENKAYAIFIRNSELFL